MTREEAIKIIQNEYKCVDRECDIERSCGKCPYMIPTKEPILQAYDMAIQALSQEPCLYSTKDGYCQYDDIAETIPTEQEPCDAISRDAVLSIIDGWYEQNRETENIEDLIILITYMDSVTQKSGKWEDLHRCWVCSECGQQTHIEHKYCPNCGCRMVEPQESEDKE